MLYKCFEIDILVLVYFGCWWWWFLVYNEIRMILIIV